MPREGPSKEVPWEQRPEREGWWKCLTFTLFVWVALAWEPTGFHDQSRDLIQSSRLRSQTAKGSALSSAPLETRGFEWGLHLWEGEWGGMGGGELPGAAWGLEQVPRQKRGQRAPRAV